MKNILMRLAGWKPLKEIPPQGDYMIETYHSDGVKDVSRMINGRICVYDPKTIAEILFFRITLVLNSEQNDKTSVATVDASTTSAGSTKENK